jgi:hypothetical protein
MSRTNASENETSVYRLSVVHEVAHRAMLHARCGQAHLSIIVLFS